MIIWTADSKDMDFRNDKWESVKLGYQNVSRIVLTKEYPKSGYRAFYVNLKYKDANGNEYTESTRVFMTDDKKLL